MRSIIFFILIFLFSCQSKTYRILNNGNFEENSFSEVIPFYYENGLPIIIVNINNTDYRFLFDTGAPTVVDQRIVDEIDFKSKSINKMTDSHGFHQQEILGIIKNINLGSLKLKNIGAYVLDLHKAPSIACFDLDGIIGANVMAKAHWKIDYRNEEIIVNDKSYNLKFSTPHKTIKFRTQNPQKTPHITIYLNSDVNDDATFDTGFNGSITLNYSSFYKIVDSLNNNVYKLGIGSEGIYGNHKQEQIIYNRLYHIKFDSADVGDAIIKFQEDGNSSLIGNEFLENFDVYLDWQNESIHLVKHSHNNQKLVNYGFSLRLNNGNLEVASLMKHSVARKIGLKIGDVIVKINDIEFANLNSEEKCDMLLNFSQKFDTEIKMIILRDGVRQSFILQKEVFIDEKTS